MLLTAALPAAAHQVDAPAAPPPPADAPAPQPQGPPVPVATVTVVARRPTTVSGVTVVAQGWCPRPDPTRYPADRDPAVTDSYPAQGATVPPGATSVRISFDSPMTCDWDVEIDDGIGLKDPCAKAGAWVLPGRRTFLTQCVLLPRTRYVFRFRRSGGDGRSGGGGFVGLSGRQAQPFELAFVTSDAKPRPTSAPSLDPRPTNGETAKAYVTCIDQGNNEGPGACERALIDTTAPPAP